MLQTATLNICKYIHKLNSTSFVVGMPRSGSTLVEQMLASHLQEDLTSF
jgi:hypothetical protein